jgi:DNA-binding transcriptional regulator YdaS (Cro superfamily)
MDNDSPAIDSGFAAAVRAAGSQAELARIIGKPQQTVNDAVVSGRRIWPEEVLKIEAATGVSRHDLRPDLYPRESVADGAAR